MRFRPLVLKTKIEKSRFPDFFRISEHLSVCMDGKLILEKTGEPAKISLARAGYASAKSELVHRLVADALIHNSDPEKYIQINHVDGNKLNFAPKNLEWVTARENIVHACETGLIKNAGAILVKTVKTGEIRRFYSMQECARQLNTIAANIHHYVNAADKGRLRFGEYLIIREGEEWPEVSEQGFVNGLPRQIEVIDSSGNVMIYSSSTSAGKALGVTTSMVTFIVKTKVPDSEGYHHYKGYRLKIREDLGQPNRTTTRGGNRTNPRKQKCLILRSAVSDEVLLFENSNQAAEYFKTTRLSFQMTTLYGGGVYRGYNVEYVQ